MSIKTYTHDLNLSLRFKVLAIGKKWNRFKNEVFVEKAIAALTKIDEKQDKANELILQERERIVTQQKARAATLKAALDAVPRQALAQLDKLDKLAEI